MEFSQLVRMLPEQAREEAGAHTVMSGARPGTPLWL